MIDLGVVRPGSTIRIPFNTFKGADGSSITMTNFAVADILVYKDGSTTERASTAGYTATTDFDAKTGKQLAVIDLADNTTANFWAAGSEYLVAVDAVTVDGFTTGGWVARFRIGYEGATLDTTIATLSSQTSFTLTVGPAENDALKGQWAIIHDIASAVQHARVLISAYTGSTKTVTLVAGATFTVAAGDNISIMGPAPLQPTTLGNTLDVASTGEAGMDWGNIANKTTTNAFTNTTIATTQQVDLNTIKTQAVTCGGGVTIPAATLASTTNITAATGITVSTNSDKTGYSLTATTGLGNQTANITGNLSGSVGSVTVVSDKTGYSLSQTFPTNFSAMSITAGGIVKSDLDTIKTQTVTCGAGVTVSPYVGATGAAINGTNVNTLSSHDPGTTIGTSTYAGGAVSGITGVTFPATVGDATLANQTTILNRLGAWTGSGINTILGAFRALMAKAASLTPTDISSGTTFDNTTDSTEAIRDASLAMTSNVKKNQALTAFQFVMIDTTTKVPISGKTVTVTRSIDGGAFAAGTLSAVTELSDGVYGVNFGAGDLNGNVIILKATATGCDVTLERLVTQP